MKNHILSLLLGLLITSFSFAQKNEYQYIALRFGASHGFSGQPEMNPNKYLKAPGYTSSDVQEMQLTPTSSFLGYTPGFVGSILYHFDFVSDNAGIFTGLDYNYTGISSKYETQHGGHNLIETHRIHMAGIPLAVKYGPDIWDTQRYVYVGVQFNYIVAVNAVQKVDWNTTASSEKLQGDEYKNTTFSMFLGVNYKFINLQFDFYPTTIFNKTFTESNSITGGEYLKYDGQVDKFFSFKTSINIPYGWLSEQSFWWRRKLRKLPWK